MIRKMILVMGMSMALGVSGSVFAGSHNPCNPCSMHANPCNPCSMKKMGHNPCAMNPCNPCSMKKDMKKHNPCAMNPCSMNPCAGDLKKKIRSGNFKNFQDAASAGKKMWEDETLGKSGLACLSCHADYDNLNLEKRQNYPHYVKMVNDVVTLDQMINYCMLNPMVGEQLEANSKAMTAMAAYYRAYRMKYLKENK